MTKLTVTRKADRKKMAAIIYDLATSLGAEAVIKPEDPASSFDSRRTVVGITAARGLKVGVSFDGGTSQPDVWVLSWHVDIDYDTCLDDGFGGQVNPHHFAKATYVAYGFDHLKEQLARGLSKAADGSAFSDEREAAKIAKSGETALQRRARFKAYFDEENAKRDAQKPAAA